METIYWVLVTILFTLGISLKIISHIEKRQMTGRKAKQTALKLSAIGSVGYVAFICILQGMLHIETQAVGIIVVMAILIPYFTIGVYYITIGPRHQPDEETKRQGILLHGLVK